MVGELDALSLQADELPALAAERTRLANTGRLAETARAALELLYEAENGSAQSQAARALGLLRQGAALDARLGDLLHGLDEAVAGLTEAGRSLTRYLDGLEADPTRQEQIEQRLAAIESLARKHRVAPGELPTKATELHAELARLDGVSQGLESLRAGVSAAVQAWQRCAAQLSAARQRAAQELGTAISARMQTLGMAGGRFEVALQPIAAEAALTTPAGLEEVEFLVSANAGQPPRPLARIASGGELSRLSLAVQVTLAGRATRSDAAEPARLRTCMVFDEVDSGVGGAVAEIVGRELAALGRGTQVLCVTHLPQVAALADRHLRISKLTDGRTTRTQVTPLAGATRIEEVARMLGGIDITATAREHAAEMLEAGSRLSPSALLGADTPAGGSARRSRGRAR